MIIVVVIFLIFPQGNMGVIIPTVIHSYYGAVIHVPVLVSLFDILS